MDRDALAEQLNTLLNIERHGLGVQLLATTPHLTPDTYPVWNEIRDLIHLTDEHTEKLSGLFTRLELRARPGVFNPSVANYNYQTVESLLPLLIAEQKQEVQVYESALDQIDDENIRAELQAMLEDNRRQLDRFEELFNDLNAATA